MIRAVLDTNIIVSALLQPLGPPAQVFVLALAVDDYFIPVFGYPRCRARSPMRRTEVNPVAGRGIMGPWQ